MNNVFDIAVIGGGLAGSTGAAHAARRGARVALLEAGAFPRHKVCGEFLSPDARPVLRRLGVEEQLLNAGAREISSARLVVGRDYLELPLPKPALAVSRWILDEVLWENARESGAHCFEKTRVRAVENKRIFTSRGDFLVREILLAGGRNSGVDSPPSTGGLATSRARKNAARFIGLKSHLRDVDLEEGVTELHVFQGGYCGLVRIENDLANVCMLIRYEVWRRSGARSPEEFFRFVLAQCPLLRQRVANAQSAASWLATGNVRFEKNTGYETALCGDAAQFIHPFTGDGMAMALRSGELAGATLAARRKAGDGSALYAAAWRREFAARLNWAGALAPLFLEPQGARLALAATRVFPGLAPLLLAKTRGH
jgi:menaquinone-9 beta-reductase